MKVFLSLLSLFSPVASQAEGVSQTSSPSPTVVASIAPLQFLAAGVMKGRGRPHRLLNPGQSPHTYHLRPRDAHLLSQADLIICVGKGLESFLETPLKNLASQGKILKLLEEETLDLLPSRPLETTQENHPTSCSCHQGSLPDPHLWLSPQNGQKIVDLIKESLIELDPAGQELYEKNSQELKNAIEKAMEKWRQDLSQVQDRPYVVFHDGYQYWEDFFHLTGQGALVTHPEMGLSPQTLEKVRRSIETGQVVCIFSEVQFPSSLLSKVTQNLPSVGKGILDPYGFHLPEPESPEFEKENSYIALLSRLSEAFYQGLKKK